MASPTPDPLPVGLGVEIDRAVRLTDEGHVLVGGSPPGALRLPPEGVSAVIRWLSGAMPAHHGERRIARALVDAGLAHPRPASAAPVPGVQVAVVGAERHLELEATLDGLRQEHPDLRPVVVGATSLGAQVARARGLHVVPGPLDGAEARAVALRVCDAPVVALVDAGTRPAPGWLVTALGHFADPGVAAVVPRVLAERVRSGPRGMFVASLSALHADRGPDPAPILPWGHGLGRPAPTHGPAASPEPVPALLVRRGLAEPDPSLGTTADVDLLWRLAERGWTVRYEPRSRVRTAPLTDLRSHLLSRFEAGAAAGPLTRRHGRGVAGPELPLSGVVGLGLALSGRPLAGLAVCALGGAATARELVREAGVPARDTVRPVAVDLAHTVRTGARFARTAHWPLVAAVAVSGAVVWARERPSRADTPPGIRRPPGSGRGARPGKRALIAAAVLTVPHLVSWRRRHGVAPVGPLAWTGLSVAGDAARSLGTWWGAVRSGSPAPLVPRVRPPVLATSLESVQVAEGVEGAVRKTASGVVLSRC
ncbi:glycosyltransferase [Nocardiopsis sp. L17-MgMaSL7]|uniref:glycosyltransferase n=1 Tax=Nocardiopsis sp. L17-MgMaSL7 TaxID=1938893 RepID=UPI000D71263B|nr:glycosyltransferase [Nocardiopsis sp. L17-MgMaSL7]PWV58182.1 glycosyl transferase family 2 [Nocardiopsis sp. L17-MgMaSL7]